MMVLAPLHRTLSREGELCALRAGDLASLEQSPKRLVISKETRELQLRDSAGIAPASPLLSALGQTPAMLRGIDSPRFSCQVVMIGLNRTFVKISVVLCLNHLGDDNRLVPQMLKTVELAHLFGKEVYDDVAVIEHGPAAA